ncbi:hypothetical protein [Actinoplanes sp. GCM10030250]|uniref:hypothetical protein n=1 Tax=Actinoplanes sp. GCM10030250 TaxID=3273376 RepID=UPI003620BB3E
MTATSVLDLTVFAVVAFLVVLFLVVEITSAVLPVLIVITMVPREDRRELAELLATIDSSRRLRLWSALRAAVRSRRTLRAAARARRTLLLSGRSPGSPR